MACRLLGRCTRVLCRASSQAPAAAAARLPPSGVWPAEVQRAVGWPGVSERFMCERNFFPKNSPVSDNVKQFNQDLEKATVPEEVLQAWETHRGSCNKAAEVLVKWTFMVHRTNGDIKLLMKDSRVSDLMRTVTAKVTQVWHRNLVSVLKALWIMDLPTKNATLCSVQAEVMWRLRRLSPKHLAVLVDSGSSRTGQQDRAIVTNSIKQLELRWTEIEDFRVLTSLISNGRVMTPSLMDRLEDKALEFAEHLSAEQIRKICVSLATQNRRSVALLRALSYYLLQKPQSDFTPPLIMDMAFAYGKLGFHHEILQRLTSELLPHAPELPPADVVRCSKSLSFLRLLHVPLFEAFSENYIANSESYTCSHLCNLLMTFGRLNFQPSKGEEFFTKAHSLLETSLPDMEPVLRTDVVWSLCVLQQSKPHYLIPLTKQEHLSKLSGPDHRRQENTWLKPLHIAAALHLEHPGSSDSAAPLAPPPPAPSPQSLPTKVSPLQASLRQSLQSLATDRKATLQVGLETQYGWTIDGELVVDSHNNPQNRGGNPTLPAGPQRIAFLAMEFPHFSNNREPLGWSVMKKRHLQLAGFIAVEVPYYEWMELKTEKQKQAYLKDKMRNAVAKEMAK